MPTYSTQYTNYTSTTSTPNTFNTSYMTTSTTPPTTSNMSTTSYTYSSTTPFLAGSTAFNATSSFDDDELTFVAHISTLSLDGSTNPVCSASIVRLKYPAVFMTSASCFENIWF